MTCLVVPTVKHEEVYRVYYEDVDYAGIVYYANYFKFIERARTEMLRDRGITHTNLRNLLNVGFVVKKVSADFMAPLKFDDLVKVQSEITRLTQVRVEINQIILSRHVKLFEADVTIACTDSNGHLVKIPNVVHERLKTHPFKTDERVSTLPI